MRFSRPEITATVPLVFALMLIITLADPMWHTHIGFAMMAALLVGAFVVLGRAIYSTIRAKRALANFSRDFEAFLAQTTDFVYFKDADGRIRFCSQTLADITGHASWRDMVGKHDREIFPPDTAEVYEEEERPILSEGKPLLGRIDPYYDAAGNPRIVQTNKWPLFDEAGQVAGIFGISRDVTEAVQAEQRELLRTNVLKRLIEKEPLQRILDSIVRDIEKTIPNTVCSILLADSNGERLHVAAAPNLPEFFNRSVDGISIASGIGSCGTAAHSGERVIVTDISIHPWWHSFREVAAQAGLASCWAQPIVAGSGKVLGTLAIYHRKPSEPSAAELKLVEVITDVTALAIEHDATDSHLRLSASVFTHAREGIIITDAHGHIVDTNEAFSCITGYSRDEALGRNPSFLQSGRHPEEFYRTMWQTIIDQGSWSGEIWNKRKDGALYAELLTISAIPQADGKTQNYVALFTDITRLKEEQQQLESVAHIDALTGLPNRRLLSERLQQAIASSLRRNNSLAVVYLDLDGFKTINDSHGHAAGDELLISVAQRMRGVLRESDTLARIGGDEFVAVLTDLERSWDFSPLLKRLLQVAATPITVGEHTVQVSVSIGMTFFPQDSADADLLMQQADQAMYQAKLAGKNRYHIFSSAQEKQ